MSQRSRKPTEDQKTEVFDKRHMRPPQVEIATPTVVDPAADPSGPAKQALRVISMKTPADLADAKKQADRQQRHQVQIRPMANLRPDAETPSASRLGRLAPPRDPREVRARRMRDYVIWGCAVVILASAVMLAVWFIARR
jgi:hypothetical protein